MLEKIHLEEAAKQQEAEKQKQVAQEQVSARGFFVPACCITNYSFLFCGLWLICMFIYLFVQWTVILLQFHTNVNCFATGCLTHWLPY